MSYTRMNSQLLLISAHLYGSSHSLLPHHRNRQLFPT